MINPYPLLVLNHLQVPVTFAMAICSYFSFKFKNRKVCLWDTNKLLVCVPQSSNFSFPGFLVEKGSAGRIRVAKLTEMERL